VDYFYGTSFLTGAFSSTGLVSCLSSIVDFFTPVIGSGKSLAEGLGAGFGASAAFLGFETSTGAFLTTGLAFFDDSSALLVSGFVMVYSIE